ncbi:hypothetical protein ACIGBH_17750 [Streptomyces sp. NPDC085929]|uniref:hypothetical protein n=1 Tax=Streptomyces sp. NPDC085929 TaxID=3365739 RepID=UPI0037D84A8F
MLLCLAFWISWVCFTVYGNVEGIRAGTPGLLLAMSGLAVMVSAVPRIRTDHTTAFVCAYVFRRRGSSRCGSTRPCGTGCGPSASPSIC